MRDLPPLLVIAAAVLLAATATASSEQMHRVVVYEGHATLEVPANWREIPPEILEYQSLKAAEVSGGRTAEIYQHGFRPGDPEVGFSLPQILIQIRESGRLPYGQFLHLPPLAVLRSRDGRPPVEQTGPMLDHVALNEASFDHASYSLRTSYTFFLENAGKVVVDSASFLTERGLFTVHCYTAASVASVDRPLFNDIFSSVRFDAELAYQPRLADRWPPRRAALALGAAALVAILVLILALRRRAHS